jgi:hypothetical protein
MASWPTGARRSSSDPGWGGSARSAVVHLDAGGHQHLAPVAAPVPAFGRIVLAPQGEDRRLVDVHQGGQHGASRGDNRPAQLGGEKTRASDRALAIVVLALDETGLGILVVTVLAEPI